MVGIDNLNKKKGRSLRPFTMEELMITDLTFCESNLFIGNSFDDLMKVNYILAENGYKLSYENDDKSNDYIKYTYIKEASDDTYVIYLYIYRYENTMEFRDNWDRVIPLSKPRNVHELNLGFIRIKVCW